MSADMSVDRRSVPLLAIEDLSIEFRTRSGIVQALDSVGFAIKRGETMALVGESGSGKSVTAHAVMGILDTAARVTQGSILFGGLELLTAERKVLDEVRGREVAIIFQNPRTALNPIRPIGLQIADILLRHGNVSRAQAPGRAIEMLARVRIPDPKRRALAYPFELSGGMCQRVMIALALACEPALLIADEPTTGLDITTQAVIMKLIAATPGETTRLDALAAIPGGLPDLRRIDLPVCRYSARCERHSDDCMVPPLPRRDRKSIRLNSSHGYISYAVFCLKKKKNQHITERQQKHNESNDI